jgi:predicted amidohydrolase YtcJ
LEKGKYADFIILDTDLMTCKIENVLNAKIISTYINGENVFSHN